MSVAVLFGLVTDVHDEVERAAMNQPRQGNCSAVLNQSGRVADAREVRSVSRSRSTYSRCDVVQLTTSGHDAVRALRDRGRACEGLFSFDDVDGAYGAGCDLKGAGALICEPTENAALNQTLHDALDRDAFNRNDTSEQSSQ